MGLPLVGAVAIGLAFLLGGGLGTRAQDNGPQELSYIYSAKFVCGTAGPGDPLLPGDYSTAINVHNLQDFEVRVFKKAVLAPPETQSPGQPTAWKVLDIPADAAFEIDCPDIRSFFDIEPPPFIKGFVVIESLVELDVWGVYTSSQTLGAPTAGTGIAEDIEVVPPKRAEALGPNFDDNGPPYGIGAGIGNGSGLAGHDGTVPNSDTVTDNWDPDDDNDLLADGADADPRGDNTYDDNNNGNPANGCYGGTDLLDDGPSWDTNCDAILDGWVGGCGSTVNDADADGMKDAWENCKWGTNPAVQDSDGDDPDGPGGAIKRSDCGEAMDVNGNGVLTNADAVFIKQAFFGVIGKDGDFDINGNNIITNADAVFVQQAFFGVNPCL